MRTLNISRRAPRQTLSRCRLKVNPDREVPLLLLSNKKSRGTSCFESAAEPMTRPRSLPLRAQLPRPPLPSPTCPSALPPRARLPSPPAPSRATFKASRSLERVRCRRTSAARPWPPSARSPPRRKRRTRGRKRRGRRGGIGRK